MPARAIAGNALEWQVAPFFGDPRWTSFIAKLMAINITFKAPFHILHKVDSVSAPFGAVARSPLFDRAVVELAMSIPPQLKLRGSSEKYLLKQAVRDLLPPAIIERPKSGMLVPVEGWFKGPLLSVARERAAGWPGRPRIVRAHVSRAAARRTNGYSAPAPRREDLAAADAGVVAALDPEARMKTFRGLPLDKQDRS